jgi:hypothetical protein
MKSTTKFILVIIIFLFCTTSETRTKAQSVSVSFQVFYDDLSPYGTWVEYSPYGYVWIPDVGSGFSPYASNGYWVWTDYGWTWVSDYSWGWCPFHYGRWDYISTYGWFWVPDYAWGPAWVCWRQSPGYYGWAPLRPGITVSMAIGGRYHPPYRRWCFADEHYMGDRYIGRHYIPRNNNHSIIDKSAVIRNTYKDPSRHTTVISGPRREDVQKVSGRNISRVAIADRSQPGHVMQGNRLSIYRPNVVRSSDKSAPRPSKVENIKNVIPVRQRNAGTPKSNVRNKEQIQRTQPRGKTQGTAPQSRKQAPVQRQPQRQQPQRQQERTQPQPRQRPNNVRPPVRENQPRINPQRQMPERMPQRQVPQQMPQRQMPQQMPQHRGR